MYGETLDFSNSSMEEVLMSNLLQKLISELAFYVTIADADIGSLKSYHTFFDKYLDHILIKFEQNRKVQTIQKFVLFDKKWLTIFDNVLTPFWNISVTETFVWCLTIDLKTTTF